VFETGMGIYYRDKPTHFVGVIIDVSSLKDDVALAKRIEQVTG